MKKCVDDMGECNCVHCKRSVFPDTVPCR